jgi:transcription initiation factor TFIID subunit 9B
MEQYLATLAHELNSQPLPTLPETFDVLRLPPPHQRLGEVNFDIVPDSGLVLEEEGDEDEEEGESESEEEVDEVRTEDGDINGFRGGEGDGDAEGEDEDMDEVGIAAEPGAVRQEREVDEDYDA